MGRDHLLGRRGSEAGVGDRGSAGSRRVRWVRGLVGANVGAMVHTSTPRGCSRQLWVVVVAWSVDGVCCPLRGTADSSVTSAAGFVWLTASWYLGSERDCGQGPSTPECIVERFAHARSTYTVRIRMNDTPDIMCTIEEGQAHIACPERAEAIGSNVHIEYQRAIRYRSAAPRSPWRHYNGVCQHVGYIQEQYRT